MSAASAADPVAAGRPLPAVPPGWTLVARGAVGSTNDEARALAEAGAADRTVVWAAEQTGGRGRRGRPWASPPGNLHSSAVLRPAVPLARAAQLGFVAALAVADTVAALAPGLAGIGVKWPNDVLVGRRKISGLLLEAGGPDAAGTRVDWLVLGCGLNLARHPEGGGFPATDLAAATGAPAPQPAAALACYLAALDRWLAIWLRDGFSGVREAWLGRAVGLGAEIEARLARETVVGRFRGIDGQGALLLALAGGGERRIAAGDVHFGAG